MSDLGADLARAYEARVAATDVELTPAALRTVVRDLVVCQANFKQ